MTKGNTLQRCTHRTQSRARVSQVLGRVRQAARREQTQRMTVLLHHLSVDCLREAYYALKRDAAQGSMGRPRRNMGRTWRGVSTTSITGSTARRIMLNLSADSISRRRMAASGRSALRRWKTKSSSVPWSPCGNALATEMTRTRVLATIVRGRPERGASCRPQKPK